MVDYDSTINLNDEPGDATFANQDNPTTGESQIQSLSVSHGFSEDTDRTQAGSDTSPQDGGPTLVELLPGGASEKVCSDTLNTSQHVKRPTHLILF
jgi:hypothetical protein